MSDTVKHKSIMGLTYVPPIHKTEGDGRCGWPPLWRKGARRHAVPRTHIGQVLVCYQTRQYVCPLAATKPVQ